MKKYIQNFKCENVKQDTLLKILELIHSVKVLC